MPGPLPASGQGGTTHLYRSGAQLEWIRLRGRWKASGSLEHYIQEAVAWMLCNRIAPDAKILIQQRSDECWNLVLASVEELWHTVHAGRAAKADCREEVALPVWRRRISLQQQVRELRQALAADFLESDND